MKNNEIEEPNIELVGGEGDKIIIKGKKLNCEWLDSYILVWSDEDHPYKSPKKSRRT